MIRLEALFQLIAQGESETLEFKRSTAELKRAGETLCAFLNGEGGKVLIGGATVTKANVSASNGIIHVIDKVLIP